MLEAAVWAGTWLAVANGLCCFTPFSLTIFTEAKSEWRLAFQSAGPVLPGFERQNALIVANAVPGCAKVPFDPGDKPNITKLEISRN